MTGLILGVDVGNAGGLAIVTPDGRLIEVEPMPVLNDGPKGRPVVNAVLLATIVRRWAPDSAFVELVGPRPGEAAGGAFSFGRARGLIEGVLAANGVPTRMIAPAVWKRACGIPAGREGAKDLARAEACRRWPGMAERFAAKGSDGLAEAGLIACAVMGVILTFRPRHDVVVVEYDVSGWLVSRVDRHGDRQLLLDAPAISVAIDAAKEFAAFDGSRIVLGPGATGWRTAIWRKAQ